MQDHLLDIKNEAIAQILSSKTPEQLEEVRVEYLGKSKGRLTAIIKKIPSLPQEEKGIVGQFANEVKANIEQALETQQKSLQQEKVANIAQSEWIDVTLPAVPPPQGHLHMQTQVLSDVLEIFKHLGYQVADGLEIESEYYNFTALNMPPNSPSRDTQATFYLDPRGSKTKEGEIIARTQLSGMQVRIMEKTPPPMRVVIPGKVYRVDDVDASHGFEFWQLEGLCVDTNIRLTDLLGTMDYVLHSLYGAKQKIRYDTTHFAFVEPGVQAFLECTVCGGKGCPFCKRTGWVETMPAGLVHPEVLKAGGLDPEKYTGFAFAVGLSRAVTLKYQIDDLRVLTSPDLRILNQF